MREESDETWRVGGEWWLEGVLYRELRHRDGSVSAYVDPQLAELFAEKLNQPAPKDQVLTYVAQCVPDLSVVRPPA